MSLHLRALSRTLKASLLMTTFFASVNIAQAQTLDEALSMAYSSNPALQAARYQTRSVDESVSQARAGYRPTVQFSGSTGVSHSDVDGFEADTNPVSLGAQVTQPLYRGGRTTSGVALAENNVRSSRNSLVGTEQEILLNVVTSYMDVYQYQSVLQLNTNNERVLAKQLEATKDRFSVGEVTKTDVSQAESRKARATSDRIEAMGNLSTARANFERYVGQVPVDLDKPSFTYQLPATLEESLALAKQNNPNLKAAEYALEASSNNIDVVRGEVLPEVSAVASYAKDWEPSSSVDEQEVFTGVVQLSVPLYQSGAVSSRVRSAKHVKRQRELELRDSLRSVQESTIQAWDLLSTARASIISRRAQVRAAQIALDGVKQEANVGSRTVLDTLDAEQELLDARVNLVSAERSEMVASYQLLAALGKLTAKDLGLDVALYSPEQHYEDVKGKWWGFSIEDASE